MATESKLLVILALVAIAGIAITLDTDSHGVPALQGKAAELIAEHLFARE